MKTYDIQLEIAGPTAMWTRPDTGDTPVSYPAPTYGAVKGIFESILWLKQAEVVPYKVEICKPVIFYNYTTNYGGPLRKSGLLNSGGSFQFFATVLVNVCYRMHAHVKHDDKSDEAFLKKSTNGGHAYQAIFDRRLNNGQCFSIPCLGWKEFTPDYVGPFREKTVVESAINLEIPSMLKACFPEGKSSMYQPVFVQDVNIEKGVLNYD